MYCPKCGAKNPDDSNFCQMCAFKLSPNKNHMLPKMINGKPVIDGKKIVGSPVSNSNEVKFVLKGYNGQLYVYSDKIEIKRKGFFAFVNQGLKGTKTIPIKEIKSIQVKPAGLMQGYIQFGILGGLESTKAIQAAKTDENSVTFANRKDNQTAINIKKYLENIMLNKSEKSSSTIVTSVSEADELRKFKELLDEGIITQEEFNIKRKQLLGL